MSRPVHGIRRCKMCRVLKRFEGSCPAFWPQTPLIQSFHHCLDLPTSLLGCLLLLVGQFRAKDQLPVNFLPRSPRCMAGVVWKGDSCDGILELGKLVVGLPDTGG